MSILKELIHPELINLENHSKNQADFFDEASKALESKGFVNNTFVEAIKKREENYPTGLELEKISIAIPHTDVEHIIKPFVYINKVSSTDLTFIQMGSDDSQIQPKYVIILGIKDPKGQVGLLSELIELFNNEKFVDELESLQTETELEEAFKNNL